MNSLFRWLVLGWAVCVAPTALPAATLGVTNRPTERYVVGLSPFLDPARKDDIFRQVVGFLLEGIPLGSSVGFYDAYHLRTIATLTVPEVAAFRSAKTRANQFRTQIGQVRQFLAVDPPRPATNGWTFEGAIRVPQFLDFVSAHLRSPDVPITVILLGNPLHLDPKEPGFSMVDGYFPSDGHLSVGRDRSVYGTLDRRDALSSVTVHWGYLNDPWVSDVHQEKVHRFWTLFVESQEGRLASLCGDLPTLFSGARGILPAEGESPRWERSAKPGKLEMLRLTRDVGLTDWISQDTITREGRTPPTVRVGSMKIGIRWQGNLDLDLYARPRRGAEPLFFDHVRSPDGYYFKDHRSSPEREFEFIEFESDVSVDAVEAQVNYYAGSSETPPEGEVRIEFAGRIYSGRFSLGAREGNQGRTGGGQSRYWTTLDIPEVLGLSSR
ncbi:MAG: hypothetical protein J0M24_00795 [Verrucomicrobia bacterium]|nr:hypothetical protein [Verrucomicrobiota bacterium]